MMKEVNLLVYGNLFKGEDILSEDLHSMVFWFIRYENMEPYTGVLIYKNQCKIKVKNGFVLEVSEENGRKKAEPKDKQQFQEPKANRDLYKLLPFIEIQ
nr:MAG TPA: hypothetical protein [Caudoviricetes sp.]